jgi:hypothetical protein
MLSLKSFVLAALAVSTVAAQCDSDITIQSDGDVSKIASCTKLDGTITIGTKATSITLPTSLTSITGDLVANGAANLRTLEAPGLRSIQGTFNLKGLITLNSLVFPDLVSVNTIQWETLPALAALSFTQEVSMADTVLITDTVLTELRGINLQTVSSLNINNNNYLKSIDVALSNVSQSLTISSNGRNLNVSLPNLIWANNLTVRDASALYVPSLKTVNSSMAFINDTFTTIDFPKLTEVGESLAFVSCSKLTNVTVDNLESVGGTFQMANNTKLSVVKFAELSKVGGAVDFSGAFTSVDLPSLEDVRGGFNLQSTKDLSCKPFDEYHTNGVIKGNDYTCEGKQKTAESKTSGLGTNGSGGGSSSGNSGSDAAGRAAVSVVLAAFAGAAALMVL